MTCSLPRGKSHGEDGSSKPFMSEWELDVLFGFVEWTFKYLNVGFLLNGLSHIETLRELVYVYKFWTTTLGLGPKGQPKFVERRSYRQSEP